MNCLEAGRLLGAYLDHELDPADAAQVRAHVDGCAACRQRLADHESLGRLVRRIPYLPASDELRARVLRASRRRRLTPRLQALAAGLVLAASVGGSVELARFMRARQAEQMTASIAESAVNDHVRALKDERLVDVRSTDQHTVKPWFLGKLDFSPPVADPSAIGFPLVGGRVDRLASQPVAALVYQRRLHPIDVFVQPASDRIAASDARSIRGFQVRHWTRNGMSFWAVSDLNDAELAELVSALQQ